MRSLPRNGAPDRVARAIGTVLPVLLALAIQFALWSFVEPYAWFMFVPAVFVSAWIGGLGVGIAMSALTTVLIWWFFVPPEGALGKEPRHLLPSFVFFATGVLFSLFQERLRRARRDTDAAVTSLRKSNDEVSRLYQKARELDDLKTRFFASVSHELRTPLALVIGPTERLAQVKSLDDDARRELAGVTRNARIVLRHVNELLDLAKIDAGRVKPSHADVDLASLARLVADPFSTVAQEKAIELTVVAPEHLRAEVDPDQIETVLTNLLSNALKFTPRDGRIRLSLREISGGERVSLEVADSGPGIPADRREEAFERFRQLDDDARARGGTGLGLPISRDLVSLHGGTLVLDEAPEGGTLARVELPRHAPAGASVQPHRIGRAVAAEQLADEQRERSAPPKTSMEASQGPLVLVVEDNPEMNRFLCESVPAGFRVASALDGREGLAKATSLAPDLMIVDVMMPEMSGDELVHAVRQHAALARTAILIVTAKADDELRIRLLREGAQDYLVKPVAVEELRARVRNLVAAKRALEAESQLASLVSLAPDGIFVADLDGRYTQVNEAGCRLLGYAREEIIGKTILDFIPAEQAARLASARERLIGGRDDVAEWKLRRKDGTYALVEVHARVLPDGRWQGFARDVSERHRVEQALRRSEEGFNRAQAVAHIGSWRLDVRQNELLWSLESYRIFGKSPGTPMTYEGFLDVVHPEDRERVDREWKAALRGAPYDIEHRIVAGDELKWVRERAELLFDDEGRLLGGIGTTQDITSQKQIEGALKAAEQRALEASRRIRALSDASVALSEAVTTLPENDVLAVMRVIAAQAQLLVDAEYAAIGMGTDPEVPFEPWVQVGIPDDVAARIGHPPRPIGTLGVVARHEHPLRVRDLRHVPEFRGMPASHPPMTSFLGVPIRFRGASLGSLYLANKRGGPEFTDDDERIVELLAARAGAALETARLYQSEANARTWLRTVIDQMPEGVLLLDSNGRIAMKNRGFLALARETDGGRDVFGNPILVDLRLPSGEPLDEPPYVGAMARGESSSGREHQLRRADGTFLPVLVGAAPVISAEGERTGAVMIVQDISPMKELERLREEWTSVVAHDLRQPVNVIALSAALLDTRAATLAPERRARLVSSIRRAASNLDRMIGDLLDASRIEARRMSVTPRETSLVLLVQEVVERVPDLAGRCDVEAAPGSDRPVLADAGRIEQVLTNLLSNAVKYGDPDGRVRIELLPRGGELEVVVSNRGPGIPEAELPRLFRRFERAAGARASGREGIGLGLYLCKGLVEAHRGRIWVESTPGEETRFHFTLPYAGGLLPSMAA